MSDLLFEKNITCAVTGHRILQKDFSINLLKTVINNLIDRNFTTFLVGMAVGFDTICFQVLEEIRKEKNIKIVACVPCPEQDDRFNEAQKKEYERMISLADDVIIISPKYTPTCMKKRNEFMVKNASALIAYVRRKGSGSYQTLTLAKERKLMVIEI